VVVDDHHERHEAGSVEVLALVACDRAVVFRAYVDVVFQRLLSDLAEREVVDEGGDVE
jgi:hypothetical protein